MLTPISVDLLLPILIHSCMDYRPHIHLINLITVIGHFRVLCLVPLFQNESKCETFHIKMSSACIFIFVQIKVIFIRMVSHLDSLWNRGTRELGNGLCSYIVLAIFSIVFLGNTMYSNGNIKMNCCCCWCCCLNSWTVEGWTRTTVKPSALWKKMKQKYSVMSCMPMELISWPLVCHRYPYNKVVYELDLSFLFQLCTYWVKLTQRSLPLTASTPAPIQWGKTEAFNTTAVSIYFDELSHDYYAFQYRFYVFVNANDYQNNSKSCKLTPTWFEHAAFWSGVRRATIAPRSQVSL